MIIVSQDKKEIFNFNEIFRLCVDTWSNEEFATEPKCFCIRAEKASDNMICAFLGEYSTEERAKEVMEDICRRYQVNEIYKCSTNEVQESIMAMLNDKNMEMFKFYMPEK